MAEHKVQIESWGPFAEGKNDMLHNELLQKLASAIPQKHRASGIALANQARRGGHPQVRPQRAHCEEFQRL